jgi:predicted ATPase
MFFRAQNLGPLRDAEIDLSKDLIVLAGPNNSGKTYLAWSVYGLHRMIPKLETALARVYRGKATKMHADPCFAGRRRCVGV